MFSGRKLPITLVFSVLLGLAFGVSCKGFFPDPVLQSIAVGPASQTIQTGNTNNTLQMSAVGTYSDGTRPDNKVTWSVVPADESIVTLSKSGFATAVAQGTATITATSTEIPTISGSTTLTVTTGCIQKIDVTPVDPNIRVGNPQSFTATATTCNGSVDITDVATWKSSNTAVATIDSSGVATTITTGTTDITASSGGVTSPAQTLTVNP
jgi:hypothetical protein